MCPGQRRERRRVVGCGGNGDTDETAKSAGKMAADVVARTTRKNHAVPEQGLERCLGNIATQ